MDSLIFSVDVFPSNCKCVGKRVFTYTIERDGIPPPLTNPSFLINDPITDQKFRFNPTSQADIGTYVVTISVEYLVVNPATGLNWTADESFTLNIIDPCP